jgi:RNA polymerase sigma-54 factor
MALEQKLHLKLAQKLVMTPTLQQAIKLLQLSRLELEQAIAQELQANPLLEQIEEGSADGESAGGTTASEGPAATESPGSREPTETAREADPFADVDVDALFANYLHDTARAAATWEDQEEAPLENSPDREASLFDALCTQLHLQSVEPALAAAAEFVIGNLDAAGYLRMSEEEIADQLGVAPEVAVAAVRTVQSLEPAGIAARSLQECLALQLARIEQPTGETAALALARRIVAEGFDELLHQRWERLEQRLGVDHDAVRAAVELIRHLSPRPGAQLGPIDNTSVEPDVMVTRTEQGWRVTLADDGLPRLRVSQQYLRMLRGRQADQATSGFLRERMRAALWFLRSVEQRHGTILKVAEAIVRRQSEFLDDGLPHLRPLVLRDIADDIGMHESTVSRVVANKYMSTPRGVVPMKFFFHSAISHAVDGDISSVAVKERIRQLIGDEDPLRPLSDARIARQLNRLGIRIARRTVAKYREELGMPSSEQRRRTLR